MRKLLAVVAVLALCFAGCGSKEEKGIQIQGPDGKKVEVKVK